MKKRLITLSLIFATVTVALAPVFANAPTFGEHTKIGKQDKEIKNFTGVGAGGPIHVIITLGNTEGIRFEGDQEAIETLVTEVVGSQLVIRPKTSWTSWAKKYENKKIIAHVSAKKITSLAMSGNGSIVVNGKIDDSNLAVALSGSGSVTVNAKVDRFTGVISGSGNLNVSGTAETASMTISGSGSIKGKDFSVESVSSTISGSGSVYVKANQNINAAVSGSGSINYSGNAEVNKRVSGTGKVRKV